MRVIAGSFRGRKLETVDDRTVRPTSDRVKESLFNIISEYIVDSQFLDLFAGSGAIGIEALSRGSANVSFIDSSNDSLKVLKQNLSTLHIEDKIEIYHADYKTAIEKFKLKNIKFNIIFIDPPYSKGMAQDALALIEEAEILSQDGIIAIEHNEKDDMPQSETKLFLFKQKKYGSTKLSFYTYYKSAIRKEP